MIVRTKKLFIILTNAYFLRALLKGVAAGVEHKKVLRLLGNINHVIDIGANRGQFSLVARNVFPCARIDSFEPLPAPFEKFKYIFCSDNLTTIYPFAVSSKSCEATIHISSRDDSSSLLPISKNQTSIFPGTDECETRVVVCKLLSDLINQDDIKDPALLKIDVQGFELDVLQGCSNIIEKFKYIYVECSFIELYEGQAFIDDVIKFLHRFEFSFKGIYNVHYDASGMAVQADFLFKNNGSE